MDWQAYHGTVRQAISGFDHLLTTLWIQGLTFGGAAVAAINPAGQLDREVRLTVEGAGLALGLTLFFMTWAYATLLRRAVQVGIKVEQKMAELDDDELRLTTHLDKAFLGGGNWGIFLYVSASLVAPIALTVVLALDAAGVFS